MDAAKNAVKNIIHRGGQHDTTVDENVAPAVTSETIKPHRHEETTQAIDREVHQDHYHTTVQPLQDKAILPEKHTHQQMPVQEKEYHHGDTDRIRSGVEAETAKFQSTSRVAPTTESTSTAAAATGEHVHHHVHETVQPVIHKETIQPEVVHTTIPIHETHHAQAEHHGMSTLPTKTLSEFKELGGKITGSSHRHEEYEGHPRPYNPEMQSSRGAADLNPAAHDGLHGSHGRDGLTGTTGTTSTSTSGSGLTGSGLTGSTGHHTSHTGTGSGLTGTHGTHGTGSGLTGTHGSGTTGGLSGTSGTNVSGVGNTGSDYNTGSGYTSGGVGSTAGRALDAATGHGSSSHGTSGVGTGTSRGLGDSTIGYGSTGGTGTHHNTGYTDTSSSTNTANTGSTGGYRDDVQSPRQGKDPNLVETTNTSSSGGLKGEGVPGSHSAVFGLTPDGQRYDDTRHSSTTLKPAHSSKLGESSSYDTGSRASTGSAIAQQLNDPRVNQPAHGGPNLTSSTSGKPGAGTTIPEQGFGHIRGQEHGSGSVRLQDKLDPKTDADGDGKRGIMD